MNDFQRYKEKLVKDSEARGEIKGQSSAIQKVAVRLKKLHLSDSEILQSLREDYGSSFTEEQLLGFVNGAK